MNTIANDEAAVVIIGSGAGGGAMAYELTAAGIPCVLLEAGAFIKNEDYHNDEWDAFRQMAWLDARNTSGSWRVAKDFPGLPAWIVKAVGGSTTHLSGATPRFKDYEFRARTTYGDIAGATLLDWPISLEDLAPYYDKAEIAMGSTHRHGRPALPANNNYKVFANGAERVGYKQYATGPYATNAEPYDGRPAAIQDGFNFQGDKNKSKWSPLMREIPRALETGLLDLRPDSHVVRITHGADGKADAVLYLDKDGNLHRQVARVVCVAGNSIETPRLLLLSDCSRFPTGLANGADHVGRHYIRHMTCSVYAQFDKPVHMFRGETMAGIIADEAANNPDRGFVGGYYMETLSLGPSFLAAFIEPEAWGPEFAAMMDAYANTAGMWIVGEDMPQASNRITLSATVKDQWGLAAPNVHFDDHANDTAMRDYAYGQGAEAVRDHGGGFLAPYTALSLDAQPRHLPDEREARGWCGRQMGPGARGAEPLRLGRLGDDHRRRGEPELTIVALAIRQAEYLAGELKAGNL